MNFNICITSILMLTSLSATAKYEYDGKNPPPVKRIAPLPASKPEPLRPAVTAEQYNKEEVISSNPNQRRIGAPDPRAQYTVMVNGGGEGSAPAVAPARAQMTFCQFLTDLYENKKQFRKINTHVDLIPTQAANQGFSMWGLTEIDSQTDDPKDDQMIFFNANTGLFHVIGNLNPGGRSAPLHLYSNPGNIEISDINNFKGVENFPKAAKATNGVICKRFGVTKL